MLERGKRRRRSPSAPTCTGWIGLLDGTLGLNGTVSWPPRRADRRASAAVHDRRARCQPPSPAAGARELEARQVAPRSPRLVLVTSVVMSTPIATTAIMMVEMALISGVTPSRTWL